MERTPIETFDDVALQAYRNRCGLLAFQMPLLKARYENEQFEDILRFSYATFVKCEFNNYFSPRHMVIRNANFISVTFNDCNFNDVTFIECTFVGTKFLNSNNQLRNVTFYNCTIMSNSCEMPCEFDADSDNTVRYEEWDEEEDRRERKIERIERIEAREGRRRGKW